ncbi:MAG: GAF domain-containing protein [Candidatus Caldarchaeum sp.]
MQSVLENQFLGDLLAQILFTRDPVPVLYAICDRALTMTGARNAMVLLFDNELGYMTIRAGAGPDWSPDLLGEGVYVGVEEREGITAYVAATGRSYLSPDVRAEKHYKVLFETSRSELASPVFDRNARVRGALNVESDQVGKFTEDHISALELLATATGLLLDRWDARIREEALEDIGTALDVAETEEELLKRVAEVVLRVLPVHAYSIFLWDDVEQAFVLRDTVGAATLPPTAKYEPGEGCTGWVCQHGVGIRLDDPSQDPRWRGKYLEFPREEIRAFMAVPIISRSQCIGCIRAIRKHPRNPYVDNRFTENDERLLSAIAEQLGTGLEKIRSLRKLITSERMAAWGELSARTSHIIGNRAFAIAGDIRELRRLLHHENLWKAFPEERKQVEAILQKIEEGVTRLDEILQEFRDFVTATRITPSPGDLNEAVESAAKSVFPADTPLHLRLELEPSLPTFAFDRAKVERAVSEIVENALHFMTEGTVTVRTRWAREEDFTLTHKPKRIGAFVAIEIEDEGPGIPENLKTRIFEPYQTTRVKGMGLGLSIVKGIAEAHGGSVFEGGTPGKGARFVLLLPTHPPTEKA